MKRSPKSFSDWEAAAQAAAKWAMRLDRGLTPAEQDSYAQWLAESPSHREALAEHRWAWDELDRLAGIQDTLHAVPDPDLLRPGGKLPFHYWAQAIALALVVLGVSWWATSTRPPAAVLEPQVLSSSALATPIEKRVLEDGSVVLLNRGAQIECSFTAKERRLKLVRGEASFTVTKNPNRPFIVISDGVDVRAVGTVFDVRLGRAEVEVIVSEGKVMVEHPTKSGVDMPKSVALAVVAGERAFVRYGLDGAHSFVQKMAPTEIDSHLAWQPRLLDFTDEPLSNIVAAFNRRNSVRLVLRDRDVAQLRLSATFRSDNIEGFVRLMEADFGLHAEWQDNATLVLSTAR